jgi:hypothetical protein
VDTRNPETGIKKGPVEIYDYIDSFDPENDNTDRRLLYEITKRRSGDKTDGFISDTDSSHGSNNSKAEDG